MENYIALDPTKAYGIPIHNGVLTINVSQDANYPGIDIEFIANNNVSSEKLCTKPRIVIEAPINEDGTQNNLRTLIWANPKSEDYSDSIEFTDEQMTNSINNTITNNTNYVDAIIQATQTINNALKD